LNGLTAVILQARMGSTRLHGKANLKIGSKTLLEWCVSRIKKSKRADKIIVATSNKKENDIIERKCSALGVACFRGDEENVLGRFLECALQYGVKTIARVCADQPFIQPEVIDRAIDEFHRYKPDILNTRFKPVLPIGVDVEVFDVSLLKEIYEKATRSEHLEHVTKYVYDNQERYTIRNITPYPDLYRPEIKLTVDDADDLEFCRTIVKRLGEKNVNIKRIIKLLENHPEIYYNKRDISGKRVVFVVTGGSEYGVGHLVNSLGIASHIKRITGVEVIFLVESDETNVVIERIKRKFETRIIPAVVSPYVELMEIKRLHPQFLIIDKDSRTYDANRINNLARFYPTVMFDMVGGMGYRCDMIINRNPDPSTHDYGNTRAIIYSGLKYTTIPKCEVRKRPISKISRILVSFGGEDPSHLTEAVVSLLKGLPIQTDVILFNEERRNKLKPKLSSKINLLGPMEDLPKRIRDYDLLICSGGRTLFEACSAGVPRIAIPQNQYEDRQIRYLEGLGACLRVSGKEITQLPRIFAKLSPNRLKQMVRVGKSLVDDKGTERVVQRLVFLMINRI